jgi:hypothetical protein
MCSSIEESAIKNIVGIDENTNKQIVELIFDDDIIYNNEKIFDDKFMFSYFRINLVEMTDDATVNKIYKCLLLSATNNCRGIDSNTRNNIRGGIDFNDRKNYFLRIIDFNDRKLSFF